MKIYNFSIIIIYFLIYSCGSPEVIQNKFSSINIADNIGKGYILNLSEIAEKIDYIPLETNNFSMIEEIRSIFYSSDHFIIRSIVSETEKIYIFDKDGKTFSVINKKGRGPDEYTMIYSIDVNKDTLTILSVNKINEYTFNGKLIRSILIDNVKMPFGYSQVEKLDGCHYILTPILGTQRQYKYSAVILDNKANFKLLFSYPESEVEIAKNSNSYTKSLKSVNIFSYKGLGKAISGDNEYILTHNKSYQRIDTIYKINFGKYQVTKENIATKNKISKIVSIVHPPLESENYIFFNISLSGAAHKPMKMRSRSGRDYILPSSCSIYDKRDGSFRLIDQPEDYQKGFIDDFEGGPAFWPQHISGDEHMVSFINAMDFIEYAQTHKVSDKFKKIADGLKESSNPVVVLVKLKK